MTPQKFELVVQEKVAPLLQGYDKVRVIMPSLALLSQIVGLRFMFHQDMDSIGRDSSWFEVEDCRRRTTRGGSKTIGRGSSTRLPLIFKKLAKKITVGILIFLKKSDSKIFIQISIDIKIRSS